MKFKAGPFELKVGEQSKPQRVELGGTGTVFFAGQLIEDEYNPDLRGEKAIKAYERMRRSDGQVKAALLACELPLRAAHWDIEAASESKQDQDIAQFIRENLFEGMTITWDDFLRHILLMLPFGFSVFEKVWELVDGKYHWRKLAPRLPKSIYKWKLDPEGGLAGIEQWLYKKDQYQLVSIPVEKLLVFSLGREGSNFTGTSLLRAAYKHWYYKDILYRIDGIAAERHGVGVALFKLPSTATTEGDESDMANINKIGQSLHTHERSYVALPEGYEFDLKGVTGQLHNIVASIEHHDTQIVRSILAQFINLGASDVGSYALSQDQSGFFLMSLRAVGKNICDTMNRYAIRQLVDYNWDVEKYPKLAVSGLEHRDIGVYCKAISDMVIAGLILPDREIEAELRRLLHLPAIRRTGRSTTQEFKMKEFTPFRNPRGAETYVTFKEISEELDTAEEQFVKVAKEIQDKQIEQIVDMVIKDIEKGELDKIPKIDVPNRNQMADAIEGLLLKLLEYGRTQVKQELSKQRSAVKAQEPASAPLGDIGEVKGFLRTRAMATSNVLASKLRAGMAWEALRQIKGGIVDKAALVTTLTSISDAELVATANFTVSEAFNFGRQIEAKVEGDDIDRVVYSALLDTGTCDECAKIDGTEYDFPSAEWDEVTPPYKNCDGRDRCRCVGVYVYKRERKGE